MVTKAAHHSAIRRNSESTRMKWIRYADSVLGSVKSRLRMSGMAIKIVRSDAETVPKSVVALGEVVWGHCDGDALPGYPAHC